MVYTLSRFIKVSTIGLFLAFTLILIPLDSSSIALASCQSPNFCQYRSEFNYLEQKYIFGLSDSAKELSVNSNLTSIPYPLTKDQIKDISKVLIGETSLSLSNQEIDSLYILQDKKNKFQFLKSIILAVHQHTGALAGNAGVHTRISAETPANNATNINALKRILKNVQPGNRFVIVDLVKASGDLSKLQNPDYQVLGLVDNHESGFKNMVTQIKNNGYENKVMLIMRLDGTSAGASEDLSNQDKAYRYELTIKKLINYLEVKLPDMPVKIIIGNEPDLYVERQWSDPKTASGQPRIDFIMNNYAPKVGSFIKKLAVERPDVTFITPGLSADFKNLNKQYFASMYSAGSRGFSVPANMIANFHGYSADVSAVGGGQKNLIHQKADELKSLGINNYVISELGSGQSFADSEYFLDKAKFDTTAIWVMLSTKHDFRGQDANWAFFVDPDIDNANSITLTNLVNRTKSKVIANILERSGPNIEILDNISKPVIKSSLPQSLTAVTSHNNVTFGDDNIYHAFDGNSNTRWASRSNQSSDMKFEIDLKAPYKISKISIPNTNFNKDNPSGFIVKVSTNGLLYTEIAKVTNNTNPIDLININKNARYILIEQTGSKSNWWSIDEFNLDYSNFDPTLPGDAEVPATSNFNNIYSGPDNILNAFDGNLATRWSSNSLQEPGMYFEVNLGSLKKVKGIKLDNSGSPSDSPRGYRIYVSTDKVTYTKVAENLNNSSQIDVMFGPDTPTFNGVDAKFIKIEQTGVAADKWWSIHEVIVKYGTGNPTPTITPTPTVSVTPVPSATPSPVPTVTPTPNPKDYGQLGLMIDPNNLNNIGGMPTNPVLEDLSPKWVRVEYIANAKVDYKAIINNLKSKGIKVILLVDYSSIGVPKLSSKVPVGDPKWTTYLNQYNSKLDSISKEYKDMVDTWEVWNEPDLYVNDSYDPKIPATEYARLLLSSKDILKNNNVKGKLIIGGLAAGDENYLKDVIKEADRLKSATNGASLSAYDGLGLHPYGRRPNGFDPSFGFGSLEDIVNRYQAILNKPIWITEFAIEDHNQSAKYLYDFYNDVKFRLKDKVPVMIWYCFSDAMNQNFGIVKSDGRIHSVYEVFKSLQGFENNGSSVVYSPAFIKTPNDVSNLLSNSVQLKWQNAIESVSTQSAMINKSITASSAMTTLPIAQVKSYKLRVVNVSDNFVLMESNFETSVKDYMLKNLPEDGRKIRVILESEYTENNKSIVKSYENIYTTFKKSGIPTITPTPTSTPTPIATPTPTVTPAPTATPVPSPTIDPIPTSTSRVILNAKGNKDKDKFPVVKLIIDKNGQKSEVAEKEISDEKDYIFDLAVKLAKNDRILFVYCNDTSDDGKCTADLNKPGKAGGANRDLFINYIKIDNSKISFKQKVKYENGFVGQDLMSDIKYDRSNKEDNSLYDWGKYRDVACADGNFGSFDDGKSVLFGGERLSWGPIFADQSNNKAVQIPWNGAIIAKVNWENP